MSDQRTAWHVLFAAMLTERAPSSFQITSEYRLTLEPQRADLLIERSDEAHLTEARTLKRLGVRLKKQTLGEFKSISRPFQFGDLARLMGYAWQYRSKQGDKLRPEELTLLLVVPNIMAPLRNELASNNWKIEPLGGGYHRVDTGVYWLYVVVIDEVAEVERDALLSTFGQHPRPDSEAQQWLGRFVMADEKMRKEMKNMEGYDELLERFVSELPPEVRLAGLTPEQRLAGLTADELLARFVSELPPEVRLAGLTPEQRLAGLAPEELAASLSPEKRLAGLTPEQRLAGLAPEELAASLSPEKRLVGLAPEDQVFALSDEVLRGLPDTYLDSLPPATREAIRRRIGR